MTEAQNGMAQADFAFQYATGYNIYDEDHGSLMGKAQSASQFTFGNIDPTQIKPIGAIDILNVEDQLQLSSCAGNSFSTIIEWCLWLQSGGVLKPQLSRMFAYIMGQIKCGINGDRGATLEGCIEACKEKGLCLEELAAYTGQYYTSFSAAAFADALTRKLVNFAAIRTLQEAYEFIARRVGGIFLGIPCTNEIFNAPADGKLDYYYPQKVGGHAICIVDTCEERDENGYPYLLSPGSWGKKYGYRGYRKIKPSAFMSMLNCQYTSCYGLSELAFLKPRYDWSSQLWLG